MKTFLFLCCERFCDANRNSSNYIQKSLTSIEFRKLMELNRSNARNKGDFKSIFEVDLGYFVRRDKFIWSLDISCSCDVTG